MKKGGTWTDSVNTKEINWYPLQKVDFARRKLEGANPAAITRYSTKSKHGRAIIRTHHGFLKLKTKLALFTSILVEILLGLCNFQKSYICKVLIALLLSSKNVLMYTRNGKFK